MYELSSAHERGLLRLLALTQFTAIMDFMVMMPLGPQIMHAFGIGPAHFAMAVSAYALCSGLSSFFAATYIDRFDRRRLMLAVYALFALSNLGCALAPTFPLLMLARAFAGLTGGVLGSIVMAIVSDVIPPQRRGQATGVIMTAFSLAAVAGVPAGVWLGAQFGWYAPFFLLVAFSVAIWIAGARLVPALNAHLGEGVHPMRDVLPQLIAMLAKPAHLRAYVLTFIVMSSHMLVIPFISVVLVGNYGVKIDHVAWIYVAGGAATFFTSRPVGKLADRYGKHLVFRLCALLSIVAVLFLTHMPQLPFPAIVAFFAVFMVVMSSRMIPLQALLTTIPEPSRRGAFLSINGAIQSLGVGVGSWVGGLMLSSAADGHVLGYGANGVVATIGALVAIAWIGVVRAPGQEPVVLTSAA
ncbi:MAG TPA: MFS transporter [Burkholderiaceae bacterium]